MDLLMFAIVILVALGLILLGTGILIALWIRATDKFRKKASRHLRRVGKIIGIICLAALPIGGLTILGVLFGYPPASTLLCVSFFVPFIAIAIALLVSSWKERAARLYHLTPEQRATYQALEELEIQTGAAGIADEYLGNLP